SPLLHGLGGFGFSLLILLPSTAAMGATLPAMERLSGSVRSRAIGWFYGANTLGAAAGILVTCYWAVPRFGLRATTAGAAGLNLLCAALLFSFRGSENSVAAPAKT